MSRVQMLRALVNERLTAAVEDIFGVFETTIIEYEEEVSSSKEEISRQQKLLDAILKPQIRLKRADLQQLFVCKEEVPSEQQEWSHSLDQEEPGLPHIKEEREEFIKGLEEAEVPTLTLLKSENNEEEQLPQLNPTQTEQNREAEPLASTSIEQMKIEPDREDCGVSEPVSNLDSASDLESTSDGQLLSPDCETEIEDSDDDWKETRGPRLNSNTLKSKKTRSGKGLGLSVSKKFRRSIEPSNELKPSNQITSLVCCKMCGKSLPDEMSLMRHVVINSRGYGSCGKRVDSRESLELHFAAHRTCHICSKKCSISKLEQHMQVHARQRLFRCTFCGKDFGQKNYLDEHMRSHTWEKPSFSCSVCGKSFVARGYLHVHMRLHTGEKPYSCSVCSKRFIKNGSLKDHMQIHTGGKPFSCAVCGKSFDRKGKVDTHMSVHTGEKPYSCLVCGKRFAYKTSLRKHMCDGHTRSHTNDLNFGDPLALTP